MRDITHAKPRRESDPFVEGMNAKVCTSALHQNVVTIRLPCMLKRGTYHSSAISRAPVLGMCDDVLQEAVLSATS